MSDTPKTTITAGLSDIGRQQRNDLVDDVAAHLHAAVFCSGSEQPHTLRAECQTSWLREADATKRYWRNLAIVVVTMLVAQGRLTFHKHGDVKI